MTTCPPTHARKLWWTTLLAGTMTLVAIALFAGAALGIDPPIVDVADAPVAAHVQEASPRPSNEGADAKAEPWDERMSWVAAIEIGFVATLAVLLAGLNERVRRRSPQPEPLDRLAVRVRLARGACVPEPREEPASADAILEAKVARARARLRGEREWEARVRRELEAA